MPPTRIDSYGWHTSLTSAPKPRYAGFNLPWTFHKYTLVPSAWALAATSLNLILGYGGLVSVAHPIFYAIGAPFLWALRAIASKTLGRVREAMGVGPRLS